MSAYRTIGPLVGICLRREGIVVILLVLVYVYFVAFFSY